jgi:hypothetical protein
MKTPSWTPKELALINEVVGDRCIDIEDIYAYEVSVKYYGKGFNNKIFSVGLDWNDTSKLIYVVSQLYRNGDGNIVDEVNEEVSRRPRLLKYLRTYVNRIVDAYDQRR